MCRPHTQLTDARYHEISMTNLVLSLITMMTAVTLAIDHLGRKDHHDGPRMIVDGWQQFHEFEIPVVFRGKLDGVIVFSLYVNGEISDDERYAIKDAIYLHMTRFIQNNHRVTYISGYSTYTYEGVKKLTSIKVEKLIAKAVRKLGVRCNLRVVNFEYIPG